MELQKKLDYIEYYIKKYHTKKHMLEAIRLDCVDQGLTDFYEKTLRDIKEQM